MHIKKTVLSLKWTKKNCLPAYRDHDFFKKVKSYSNQPGPVWKSNCPLHRTSCALVATASFSFVMVDNEVCSRLWRNLQLLLRLVVLLQNTSMLDLKVSNWRPDDPLRLACSPNHHTATFWLWVWSSVSEMNSWRNRMHIFYVPLLYLLSAEYFPTKLSGIIKIFSAKCETFSFSRQWFSPQKFLSVVFYILLNSEFH